MAISIAKQIIKKGVNDQIAFNIMDLNDSKKIWDKLKSICIKIGQVVVYSIIQELLYYPKITKPRKYEKLVIQIFAKVKYPYKRLQTAITLGRDLWDMIAIMIALNSLYNDFNTTIASLLEASNKTINQIQNSLQFKKAKNISKQATEGTGNLVIVFRDSSNASKKKANSYEKYYNCHNLGYFGRDCPFSDKQIN